jgi:WD40 repeat protein
VAFSADGSRVAYACRDVTARVWDIHARRELAAVKGHTAPLSTIVLSPDGSLVATGSEDQTARVWSVPDARELAVLRGHTAAVLAVAISADGRTLASGSMDMTARLWSLPSGRPLRTLGGHREWVSEIAWNGSDVLLTAAIDGTMRLWRTDGGLVASLRPIAGADGGYVATPRGHVELFGDAARVYPICRVGPWSLPFEVCEERFAVKGLAPRALAGETSFLDP